MTLKILPEKGYWIIQNSYVLILTFKNKLLIEKIELVKFFIYQAVK